MKAARYHEKGAPEVLRVDEVDIPEPGPGEVLIKIEFAGVAYGDVLQRSGGHYPVQKPLPAIPGGGVYGVVEKLGEGVDPAWLGKKVTGGVRTGGYAQYGVGSAANLQELPEGVDPKAAIAGIDLAVMSVVVLTTVARMKQGDSVWIPAAAGGVGFMAVQIARLYGAGKVFAGASSDAKRKLVVEAAGADAAFDYTKEGWSNLVKEANAGEGVDIACETVGGPVFYETLEVVKPGGHIVNYGNASDTDSPVNPRVLLRKNLTLSGFMGGPYAAQRAKAREEVIELMRAGKLKTQVGGVFSLTDASKAHRAIEDRTSTGKIIIAPWQ